MKQRAQELIYASSQNAFSRGGQTLFIDFNIHTGVPHYMKDTPAIVSGGKGTAEDKIRAMEEAGIHVVDSPADIGEAMIKALGR